MGNLELRAVKQPVQSHPARTYVVGRNHIRTSVSASPGMPFPWELSALPISSKKKVDDNVYGRW